MSTVADRPLPPVEHRVRVALPPDAAFELFTRGIARWWPWRSHSCFGEAALDVVFEPRAGGDVVEVSRHGERAVWGRLSVWDPPRRFAMSWHPGLDVREATHLRVEFTALADGGTEVLVHHGDWEARGAAAAEKRRQYDGGWPVTLAAFAACAGPPRGARAP